MCDLSAGESGADAGPHLQLGMCKQRQVLLLLRLLLPARQLLLLLLLEVCIEPVGGCHKA